MDSTLSRQIEQAADWILASQHLVAFTGAGISTDSGLPDFRGPEGVWTRRDDVFFAIGSSLVVSPANDMPRVALEAGARLILLNRGETPFDEVAHLRISTGIGEVLPSVLERVRQQLGNNLAFPGLSD